MAAIVWAGAWALQGINIARNPQLQAGAGGDTGTGGLSGDAGLTAGGAMPAGWVANMTGGVTIAGTAGGDTNLIGATAAAIAAALQTRARVSVQFVVAPIIGATGNVGWIITKNGASPWRMTFTLSGTPAAGNADTEVFVEYLWTASAGR